MPSFQLAANWPNRTLLLSLGFPLTLSPHHVPAHDEGNEQSVGSSAGGVGITWIVIETAIGTRRFQTGDTKADTNQRFAACGQLACINFFVASVGSSIVGWSVPTTYPRGIGVGIKRLTKRADL